MKNYPRIIFFLTSVLLFSCKEQKKQVESIPETVIESEELSTYSEKFRRLMLTEEGILRGFTFLTDSSEIRKNETAKFLSSSPTEMSYTVEFNELEMGDIIYHLKGNEIDTFEIDIYLKNKQSTDSLFQDFRRFYASKFQEYKAQGDSLHFWTDSVSNAEVKLKYITAEHDYGLNLYIYRKEDERPQ